MSLKAMIAIAIISIALGVFFYFYSYNTVMGQGNNNETINPDNLTTLDRMRFTCYSNDNIGLREPDTH